METLVIRLPSSIDEPAAWLVVDAHGARLSAVQTAALLHAAPLATGKRVVVLVPGVEVLLAEPELPIRGGARLAQAVPFALEEQLADDVENLHFALGRHEVDRAGTPVAAVAHDRMQGWLARLQAAQLVPDAIFPDSALLPATPGHTVVLIDADRVYARRPGAPPIVLQATPFAEALALATSAAAAPETHAIIYLTPAAWAQHQATIEQLREQLASIKVQLLPDGTLPLFAQEAVTRPPVSLLQGRYAAKSNWTDALRAWRLAAILAGCLIGLNLLGKGVQIWRLGNAEAQLDAAIEQVFREAMPGEQNAIDARRRMEARLLATRGGAPGGTQDLLEALGVLGGAVAQVSEASLEALSFRSGVLDLKVAAKDVGSLERLRQLVTERGMIAELQSSNQRAEGVEGRIQIRAQGAS